MTALNQHHRSKQVSLPPILVTDHDYEKLIRFVERSFADLPRVIGFLKQELDRADLVAPQKVPRDVVTMNSRLTFRTNADGISRTVTLVYPGQADLLAGRLSILTPVGVALLGLQPGQTMTWEDRMGDVKTLVVQNVLYQPEANGQFDL